MDGADGDSKGATALERISWQGRALTALPAAGLAAMFVWLALKATGVVWAMPEVPSEYDRPTYLEAIHANNGLKRLLTLRLPNGSSTTISFIVGKFELDDIEPHDAWMQASFGNAVLVNSVDQDEADSGGMSTSVNTGCGFKDARARLAPSSLHYHQCEGKYKSFGINRIANLATVTFKDTGQGKPCYKPGASKESIQLCVTHYLALGLDHLFEGLSSKPAAERPDTLIIPHIGTGNGLLERATFCNVFAQSLGDFVTSDDRHTLPRQIVLQAMAYEDGSLTPGDSALADALEQLEKRWNTASLHPKTDPSTLWVAAGVCLGLAVLSLIAWTPTAPYLSHDARSRLLFGLGWAMAAFGSATGFLKLVESLASSAPWTASAVSCVAIGAASTVAASYLLAAGDAFKGGFASRSV